jgi:hypothetical protein
MFTWKEKEFYNQIENHMVQNIHDKNTYIIIGHIEYNYNPYYLDVKLN